MTRRIVPALLCACALTMTASAQSGGSASPAKHVDLSNFARAESDLYFSRMMAGAGGLAKWYHIRVPTPIDRQDVIRMNRDTLYSAAVFDLDAGPVTITMPEVGSRFMSLLAINQDHYAMDVQYAPGTFTFDRAKMGTRYMIALVRTFMNPVDPADVKAANAAQDAISSSQASVGTYEAPQWDKTSHDAARTALLGVAAIGGLKDDRRFGRPEEVDPLSWIVSTAAGWGGNPSRAAMYFADAPERNDGKSPHVLRLKDVPVDGFWSVTVYNAEGYMFQNPQNANSINSVTAKPDADGSITIRFGGDPTAPNYLAITEGWNFLLRLYRPRTPVLDGSWTAPKAIPAP